MGAESRVSSDTAEDKVEIDGHLVELTNLDKIYWPDEQLRKRDMIAYYRSMAPWILPYMVDRPQVLHRFPHGITGKGFFQKNAGGQAPAWVETIRLEAETQEGAADYLVCQNEATLVYMANLGCIEMNPWNSRTEHIRHPDYMVIDLDPEEAPFDAVIQAANAVQAVLGVLDMKSLIKTSGATGLHVVVPLAARYTYEQCRQFAEDLSTLVHRRNPDLTSLERSPKKRQGKVYLDYLQNRWGQPVVAPYSLRPRPGAPVSTPLRWDEVAPGLDPAAFTIRTIHRRIQEVGDLWKEVLGPGADLEKAAGPLSEALGRL